MNENALLKYTTIYMHENATKQTLSPEMCGNTIQKINTQDLLMYEQTQQYTTCANMEKCKRKYTSPNKCLKMQY